MRTDCKRCDYCDRSLYGIGYTHDTMNDTVYCDPCRVKAKQDETMLDEIVKVVSHYKPIRYFIPKGTKVWLVYYVDTRPGPRARIQRIEFVTERNVTYYNSDLSQAESDTHLRFKVPQNHRGVEYIDVWRGFVQFVND